MLRMALLHQKLCRPLFKTKSVCVQAYWQSKKCWAYHKFKMLSLDWGFTFTSSVLSMVKCVWMLWTSNKLKKLTLNEAGFILWESSLVCVCVCMCVCVCERAHMPSFLCMLLCEILRTATSPTFPPYPIFYYQIWIFWFSCAKKYRFLFFFNFFCFPALTRLKPVWNNRSISLGSKILVMCSLVTSIFLYLLQLPSQNWPLLLAPLRNATRFALKMKFTRW